MAELGWTALEIMQEQSWLPFVYPRIMRPLLGQGAYILECMAFYE
jgi:hypothetical protein